MHKILKLLVAAAAIGVAPASAQNTFASSGGALGDSVSAADVTALLADFSISAELRGNPSGGTPSLVATTDGGAKFLIGFFECADAAKPAGCKQIMVSTAQASGGVAFEDLNAFNGRSSVTTVVYEPTNQILIFGRNIFMPGGIGRENVKLQIALFLSDMQQFVEGRRASAKSVSFVETPKLKSKISSMTAPATDEAPAVSVSLDRSAEIEIAIANSLDVDFSVKAAE
ncbi:MAG: YbjN domain-containing protein [Parvularculaceae bacterium]